MINKEKLHQILSSLWKNDDSVGKTYYNQAIQDVQIAIDSLQEEPKPKSHKGKGVECAECADYWKKKGIEIGKKSRED